MNSNDNYNETSSYYEHLLRGAGNGLEVCSCIYIDGLKETSEPYKVLNFIKHCFQKEGRDPSIVLVRLRGTRKTYTKTFKWLLEFLEKNNCENYRDSFSGLEFFSERRNTVETTWEPNISFSIWFDDFQTTAFFNIRKIFSMAMITQIIRDFNCVFDFCAAYGFYFPKRFSPIAYFHGISAPPSGGHKGEYLWRDSERLITWRDNTQIGVKHGDQRYRYNACDGFVRDTYPVMVLNKKHLERKVGSVNLLKTISTHNIGSIEESGDKFILTVKKEKLSQLQRILDENQISTSGQRMTNIIL